MRPGSYTAASDERHFRNVLGQFPTGVAVVAALDDEGSPVGMAVGSFGSVSLDPPLICFMPAKSSSTYPVVAAASHFCVSVLGAGQEDVCRAMATKGPDKFASVPWFPAPSGAPIIADSLAWIDCTPTQVHDAGDHYIVLAQVDQLAELRPGPPLVFFHGGYGSITSSSLVATPERDLVEPLRLAGRARRTMERLADDLGLECITVAPIYEQVVSLAVADAPGATYVPSNVGYRTPIQAPTGSVFVAWSEAEAEPWIAQHPGGRSAALEALTRVRRRRWSIAVGDSQYDLLEQTVGRTHLDGTRGSDIEEVMGLLRTDLFELDLNPVEAYDVRMLVAPIFDAHGVALAFAVRGFDRFLDGVEIESVAKQLVAAADSISVEVGGGDTLAAATALAKQLANA